MSSEGDPGRDPSTTALSTVAVQAGDTQIIISVLKSGDLIQLQLTEAHPDLLEIGNNQEESRKLLQEHDQLMTGLKRNEGRVQELLKQADETMEEKQGDERVYEAMALSLSEAWTTLTNHLQKRRTLLLLTCQFYDHALEFAIKIDESEELQSSGQDLIRTEAELSAELMQKYSNMKRGLLEKSMLVLNKSYELLDYLRGFQADSALQYGGGALAARNSKRKVDGLLELLQDRRRQVDQRMTRQIQDLELSRKICQWEKQEQEVMRWLREDAEQYLDQKLLGSSLSESEEILQEYKEFELKARDWGLLVERLVQQVVDMVSSGSGSAALLEVLSEKSRSLSAAHERFWNLLMDRRGNLQETNSFFSSANKAFEELAVVESGIKGLKTQTVNLPDLAKQHEELHRRIRDAAADPLLRAQIILQKLSTQSAQVGGVQRMLGYLRERVDGLSRQCQAYRELAGKRQQLLASFDDLEDKITGWIKSSNGVLSSSTQPGSALSEAQDALNKHLELSTHTQGAVKELEVAGGIVEEVRKLESSNVVELSNRVSLLRDQLQNLQRNVTVRVETLRPYVRFLLSADEVEEQVKLLDCYRNRPETEEENEEVGAAVKEVMDERWQTFLQKFLSMQDQGNNFINSANMVSESLSLNVKAATSVVEKTMENLNRKKSELTDLWTSWQLQYSQMKSVKKQWKKFKDQIKKVVNELKALEGSLTPVCKADVGRDLQMVMKLQENFSSTKPQFLPLNAEVEFLVKTAELLVLKGIPMKEKSERVGELLLVHQRVRDKIREHETVLSMAVKFHQLYQELDTLLRTEPVKGFSDPAQARLQLSQHQERQNHVNHLYKLALSLGADLTTTVRQSVLVFSVQDKLERLKQGSVNWAAQASRCEENLLSNVHYCSFKEEISELKESFKDLKKKFNNLKFNYMKKNEKLRNLKAVKNQMQQIEIYAEKLQVLKKKLQAFTLKLSSSGEKHLMDSSPRELEDGMNELQRQLGDFERTVEEYRQNLELSMKLQQAMEEYQFWCDEASSTIVRVGKYSSQCKTKEAISTLYKQFEKFVWPTIPQQEERISQITELAVRLHGAEEGKKYTEKTVHKHSEIVESIKELSSGLLDLEAKLQAESLKKPQSADENKPYDTIETPEAKETGHTPEMRGSDGTKEEPPTTKPDSRKPQPGKSLSQNTPDQTRVLSETHSYTQEAYSKTITSSSTVERKEHTHTCFSHTHTFSISNSPVERDRKIYALQKTKSSSQDTPPPVPLVHGAPHNKNEASYPAEEELSFSQNVLDPGVPLDVDVHPDHLTEESFSNDEYECTSPDDMSLPPLSETPESTVDLDGYCLSSHSTHPNQCGHQGAPSQAECYPSPTTGPTCRFRAESSSFVHSPLTVPTPTIVSSTISSILRSGKPQPGTPSERQHAAVYSVHESRTETQECVHDPAPARPGHARASNMHAPPKPPLTSEPEIRRVGGARASANPAPPPHAPIFSKHLSKATVTEGSPVTLEVEVTGYPEPAVTWLKNGRTVTGDERVSLSCKEGKHVLFIQSSAERDSGRYTVSASNQAGSASSSSALHVGGTACQDLDTLKLDWQTCFGTLCILLWLLYLLVL
ncbi:coiled-coil domain-containing protein 141 isoform X2 [Astyanax mexicanus]|uniref:coiled-coil domain-containing protein 141 isoform X2 n=1 Tax=Astyanax mexicanus TaxID=7994 RepID=UPI0020CB58E0|nr:coiled-coil domain-containing protein 141 isoform X2 [Astyanax mexicanus]